MLCRLASSLACILVAAVAAPSLARQSVPTEHVSQTVWVHAIVWDIVQGVPVVGAPIVIDGIGLLGVTDEDGLALLGPLDSGSIVLVRTQPRQHTPGYSKLHVTSPVHLVVLEVLPRGQFQTPLLEPGNGITSRFQGPISPWDDPNFSFSVTVPATALTGAGQVQVIPRPSGSKLHGMPLSLANVPLPLGCFDFRLVNEQGAPVPAPSFAEPIQVRFRPWTFAFPESLDGLDLDWLAVWRFDSASQTWLPEDAPLEISGDHLVVHLSRFSSYMIGVPQDFIIVDTAWGSFIHWTNSKPAAPSSPGPPPPLPPPPPPLSLESGYECQFSGHTPIVCGKVSAAGLASGEISAVTTLSNEITAQLSTTYGATLGKMLAQASAQISGSLSVSASGQVTFTNLQKMELHYPPGTQVTDPCYMGYGHYESVTLATLFKVGGQVIGKHLHLLGTRLNIKHLQYWENCDPICHLEPGQGAPLPPVTGLDGCP